VSLIIRNDQEFGELDEEASKGHRWGMKVPLFLFFSCSLSFAQQGGAVMPHRQPAPEVILIEAQKATQALIDRVVRGDTDAAFKHMNPEWKKIEARKNGGVVKLERKIKQGFAELQAKGITLTAAKTKHPNIAFEVDYGHIKKMVNGKLQSVGQEYKQWMVMVPTVSHATAMDRAVRPPEMHNVLLNSFQIALCKKGTNDWTFIDGAHITAAELRQLFPFLPKKDEDLQFPNRGGRLLEKSQGRGLRGFTPKDGEKEGC
jgi:hypothetical protein